MSVMVSLKIEKSCTIEIWSNQLVEVTNKRTSFICIYWISQFLSQICSILRNTHEDITRIPKTILQEANPTGGMDTSIDRIIQRTEKRSDIFASISNIWAR